MRILFGKLFAAAVLATSVAVPHALGADQVTLRYGVIEASLGLFQSIALEVAQQKGMLDKEGVILELVPLQGTSHMIDALDDGKVDISYTASPYLIQGALAGSNAVAVVGGPATTIYSLVSRPEIKSFDDLRGKAVALSKPEDIITISTQQLLAKHGLQAGDYVSTELIGTPKRSECIETGACAAAPLSQPDDYEYLAKGFNILANSSAVIPALQFTVIAANKDWAEGHRDELVRFARAMGEAYKFVSDPANKEEIIRIGAEMTGATAEITNQIYSLYFEPNIGVLPKHAEINMEGMSKIIELMGGAGLLSEPLPSADQFVDLQYLKEAGMQ